jgi:hypothetical protein
VADDAGTGDAIARGGHAMTTPFPAPALENREAGAWLAGILPRAFAVFLVLHGLAHAIGFTVPWGLGGPRGVDYSTLILNGSIDIGDTAVKAMSFLWLAAVFAFGLAGVMVWRGHRWARRTTIAVVVGSLVLCAIRVPGSVIGLVIDVVLLALLAVVPDRLIVRPDGRADD